MNEKMHYFSAEPGRAFRRPGTQSYIGAKRGPDGFVINPDVVVPIPRAEYLKSVRDFTAAVRRGDLHERTSQDYEAWQSKRAAENDRVKAAKVKLKEKKGEEPMPEPMPETLEDDDTPVQTPRRKPKKGAN